MPGHEIDRFVEPGDVIEPRDHQAYAESYARYRALYPALKATLEQPLPS